MNEQVIAIYCICDEILKSLSLIDDPQYKMTSAEVIVFALISALYYHVDYRTARLVSMPASILKTGCLGISALEQRKGFYLKISFFIRVHLFSILSVS